MSNIEDLEMSKNNLSNDSAIGGMVCGILSVIFWWFPVIGMILGIVGTMISRKAISTANRGETSGKGMAIAGLVCGIIGIVFSIPLTIALFAVL